MNSVLEDGEVSGSATSPGVENVSRSGRVRKKNSFLAAYESLDEIDKPKKKGERVKKEMTPTPKVTLSVGGSTRDRSASNSSNKPARKSSLPANNKRMKMTPAMPPKLMIDSFTDGDLEMDLPAEYGEMPNLAADEYAGYSSSDVDDRTNGYAKAKAKVKLKSQAHSTYMMEKSFAHANIKNSKKSVGSAGGTTSSSATGGGTHPGKMSKDIKKEKGPPRVTAYTLWVKDQREIFGKKYPHMDSLSLSKKLSEIWQTKPPNQRKMWKNKAEKIMRKNLNIKNSAPILPPPGKGKRRGRPRIHPLPADSDSYGVNGSSAVIAPPTKIIRRVGNFKSSSSAPKKVGTLSGSASTSAPKKGTSSIARKKPIPKKSVTNNGVGHISQVSPKASSHRPNHLYVTSPVETPPFSFSPVRQSLSPRKDDGALSPYKVTGTAPLDVAAHLALLGASLTTIGARLMDVESTQPVSGSLSVLMDSLLCAITPLVCLTQQVPELNCIPQERLNRLLDHIAYVMPGL